MVYRVLLTTLDLSVRCLRLIFGNTARALPWEHDASKTQIYQYCSVETQNSLGYDGVAEVWAIMLCRPSALVNTADCSEQSQYKMVLPYVPLLRLLAQPRIFNLDRIEHGMYNESMPSITMRYKVRMRQQQLHAHGYS